MAWYKKLFIPTDQKKEIIAYESWTVRWCKLKTSAYYADMYSFHFSASPQCEVFVEESTAQEFASRLREAFKLLQITGDFSKVTITPNQ